MRPTLSASPNLIARAALLLLFLAAAWLYAWTPASFPTRWFSQEPAGHYAELTSAYLHGQLHLERPPAPGLLALADPYDPVANAPHRVDNLSYFQGRYYLYHGIAPVLTLLVPFKVATGRYLTDPATCLVFCLGGAVFSLLLLADIRRKAAPLASGLVLAACALAVLCGHGYYLVLRGSGLNHVPIASAYFFLTVAMWGAFRVLTTHGRAWPWLLLTATAYGLAIASRPNYVIGAGALLLLPWFLHRREGVRRWAPALVALILPLVLIVAGLLLHNYLRFGQMLEFGQRYMLGAWDQRTLDFVGDLNLSENAWHYLVSPGTLGLEFPFLSAPSWQAVGALVQTPFLWLSLSVAALCFRHSARPEAAPLRQMTGLLGLILLCNLGLLLLLPSGNDEAVRTSANARYTFDFLPAWVLLTCAGVLALDHQLAGRPGLRRTWQAGALCLDLLSLLGALSLDLQRLPAESYRPLASLLNRPTHLVRHWLGLVYGPIQLDVVFPAGRPHHYEPLVATGSAQGGNLLYVFYDSPDTIRLGLVGTSMKGPLSPPIPVTYGQKHRLTIHLGSLYPSGGNPLMAALTDAEVGRLKRTLRVDLDGHTVFEVPAHFFPSKSRQVTIGSTTILPGYSSGEFAGQILSVERLLITPPPVALINGPEYGALRMVLRFPENKPGISEPLLGSGVQHAGDLVYVHYESNWQISIGLDHWGYPGLRTAWLPIDYSVNHVLEIQTGALFPPPGHVLLSPLSTAGIANLKRRVRVVLDGEVVLDAEQATYDSSPYDVFVGRNVIGGSTCGYEFSGEIKSVTRLPLPAPAP